MDAGIKPIWPSPRVIGSALTVWCHSGDNLMLHKALSLAKAGDIVVVNTQSNIANSGFGELIATSALKIGIRAVIVDGTVRDADALEAMKLPVYARGLSSIGCNKDGAGKSVRSSPAEASRSGPATLSSPIATVSQ
jgi:regulator of RNase E activity RraA